ncbi:MAG TPA: bacterial transcriptional activator domain-containing protein [Casimicrobiaceae bacterium]|jgi:Tfp pilus assembly protein PilF|nr:bacterial transcriptional activator domain-containing protein [Casimicrobiaceae bacterium]HVR94087.1 bacterial transcriptional activator domain-containing protein [Casimicrobiaceae bacterium]
MTGTSAALLQLQKLLDGGKDNALLRFGLGFEYLRAGDAGAAIAHLRQAVAFDPTYSAAWKMLGKALAETGRDQEALKAYRDGIAAAEKKGDKQAMKEMQVFARRLAKPVAPE